MALLSWLLTFSILMFTLFVLVFMSGCVYLVYIHNRYSHLPGPRRSSFFLGHIPDMRAYQKKGKILFDYFFDTYEEFGPVYVLYFFWRPVVVLTDPLYIKNVFIDSHKYVPKEKSVYRKAGFVFGQRLTGYGLFTNTDAASWLRRRQVINLGFHKQYLKNFVTPFNQVTDKLCSRLASLASDGKQVSMLQELGNTTLDVITQVAFGINFEARGDEASFFRDATIRAFEGMQASIRSLQPWWLSGIYQWRLFQTDTQRRQIEAVKFLRDFGRRCISERIKQLEMEPDDAPNDILSYIVKCTENDTLTMEDLVDEFVTIFGAGHETTASSLAFTLFEVISNPEIERKVLEEVNEVIGSKEYVEYSDLAQLKYTGQCLLEGLRKYVVAGGPVRLLTKDIEVGGFKLSAGCSVTANKFGISRSASIWENPDVFDPSRFSFPEDISNFQYIFFPFSLGPRNCVGRTFAMFEEKVILARLVKKFKFHLVPGQTAQIKEQLTLTMKDGLHCHVEVR